jgi:hypothetical protein
MYLNIYNLFFQIVNKPEKDKKDKTKIYIKNNTHQFNYFLNRNNKTKFITDIKNLSGREKNELRNFYFRIIHQLGETLLKDRSILISATEKERETERFSGRSGIKIYFWDFDFNNIPIQHNNIPIFKGKPYKNQKEISIFGVIFPHYIYAVEDKESEKIIFNPALKINNNFDEIILSGFDIDQKNFTLNLKNETGFDFGLQYNNSEFKLIS